MDDMYNSDYDYLEEEEETTDDIPTTQYVSAVAKLFRGYAYINLGVAIFTAVLTIDILAGGGNLSVFGLITAPIGGLLPVIGEYETASSLGAILDTTSILSLFAVLLGLFRRHTGNKLAEGVTLSRTRLVGETEEEQERVIRHISYINYGGKVVPVAAVSGAGIGALILFIITAIL